MSPPDGVFLLVWLVFWLGPLCLAVWTGYFLVSLPLRRQERARFFLDLLEQGLREGRTPEQTIVEVSRSRDNSLGARFHLLAAHVETGLRLGQALDKVPRLLPPRITGMLKAGEKIGDVSRVLPACSQFLKDGSSQTRGAINYVVVLALVLTPAAPAVLQVLSIFVFPKFRMILNEMEVTTPPFASWIIGQADLFALIASMLSICLYLAALIYVGGPRLASWFQWRVFPLADWLACRLSWQRKRLQRDFASLLGVLLDARVPEGQAVELAAAGTGNSVFHRRAARVTIDVARGAKLSEALGWIDDSGEFRWRLSNAGRSGDGFRAALNGWLEALDAKAFQQQQAAAHVVTTLLVLTNGVLVGALVVATFQSIVAIVNAGALW